MGEVKPKRMPDGSVYYPNPPARVLLALIPLCPVLGTLIGLPYFLSVFTPYALLIIGIPLVAIAFLAFLLLLSTWLVGGSEIGENYVELRYLFKKKRIHVNSVKKVTLDPPIHSDSLEYRYWGEPDSVMTIEFGSGKRLVASLIPNGVKLRMARILDLESHPPSE